MECWTLLVCLPAHSSAWGTGTFPTMPCSGMAAPLLGTLQLGLHGKAMPGEHMWGGQRADLPLLSPVARTSVALPDLSLC